MTLSNPDIPRPPKSAIKIAEMQMAMPMGVFFLLSIGIIRKAMTTAANSRINSTPLFKIDISPLVQGNLKN
jgi:hypothetical protein